MEILDLFSKVKIKKVDTMVPLYRDTITNPLDILYMDTEDSLRDLVSARHHSCDM